MTTFSLRSLLVALVLAAPLAACTAPVDAGEGAGSEPSAVAEKSSPLGAREAVDAKFSRWLPTPSGKIAGLMLDNGAIVHLHHDAITDANTLKAGDAVHVEGLQKDGVFKFASVSKDGNALVKAPDFKKGDFKMGDFKKGDHHKKWAHKGDHVKGDHVKGEHKKGEWKHGDKAALTPEMKEKFEAMKAKHAQELAALTDLTSTGTIEAVLPGRHGGVHGFILSDGTVAYAPHHSSIAELGLKKGDSITLAGKGGSYAIGKSMIVESVTLPSGETKKI